MRPAGPETASESPAASPAAESFDQTSKKGIRFGRVPYGSYADMYRDHQGLIDHLSTRLPEVSLALYADYAAMVKAIREGEIELAWLGPVAYIEAESILAADSRGRRRIYPIVKPERYGNSFYASEIIVRRDSGIESVAQLAGRKMAFVDPESTSGYLLAVAHLLRSGISEKDPLLTKPNFVYRYDNAVLGVLFRKFAAGAVFEGAPRLFLKGREAPRTEELMVLTRSDSVPFEPITAVVGGRLTDSDAMLAREIFLGLAAEPAILKKLQVGKFVAASADEYKPIRKIRDMVARIRTEKDTPARVQ